MNEKIKNTISTPVARKVAGVFCVIAGLVFIIMPIIPGAWLLIVGLELLGLRLLLQDKLKSRFRNYWKNKKFIEVKR